MSDKYWKSVDFDNCPECGDAAEILTDCTEERMYFDGDDARCMKCDMKGSFSVGDEDWNGSISWCYE